MDDFKLNYFQQYREKNREKLDIYHAKWVEDNKEHYRKYQREYQKKFQTEYKKKYMTQYMKKNRLDKRLKEQQEKIEALKLSLTNINECSNKHDTLQQSETTSR